MSVSKFNIQNNAEDLVGYIFQITNSSPKKLRCDLIPTMRNYSLQLMECIVRANRLERTKLNDRKKTLRINYKLFNTKQIDIDEYKRRCYCMKINLEKGTTYFLQRQLSNKYNFSCII